MTMPHFNNFKINVSFCLQGVRCAAHTLQLVVLKAIGSDNRRGLALQRMWQCHRGRSAKLLWGPVWWSMGAALTPLPPLFGGRSIFAGRRISSTFRKISGAGPWFATLLKGSQSAPALDPSKPTHLVKI